MPICKTNLLKAARMIGAKHARFIALAARHQDKFEDKWKELAAQVIRKVHQQVVDQLIEQGRFDKAKVNFEELFFKHYVESVAHAMGVAEAELEFLKDPAARLSKPPKVQVPKSLRELRILWDQFRQSGKIPARQRDLAKRVKDLYLKKVAEVWRKHSEDFRQGGVFNQEAARDKMEEAAKITYSRAKMIVETETTNYYNKTRQEIYGQTDAVTHYLFLAIRDQATTKWCSDKTTKGKRGRHGLVYAKDDPLTKQETPAIHWNCRSEMVPLTPFNPRHKKLIEDDKVQRRNVTCTPLPEGWR